MENLFENYKLDKFKIKKSRKNEDELRLIEQLSEATGWNKRAIYFQVPHNRLKEVRNLISPKKKIAN